LTAVTDTKAMLLSNNSGSSDNLGYFAFVRGDRDPANTILPNTNITTLSSNGKLQTGTQIFAGSSISADFALVGNPYASPVDLGKVTRNNLIKRFYLWDPHLNIVGGYVVVEDIDDKGTYTITPPSPGGQNNIVQSSQAFFVQTNANGPSSIEFNEPDKS